MSSSNEVRVEVDYVGNTYLRFQGRTYNVFFDCKSQTGIEISRISESTYSELAMICEDHSHMADHTLKGEIMLSDSTLKGRVTQVLADLDPEELGDEAEMNMLNGHNTTFREEAFFRIQKIVDDDDWDDINDTIDKYTVSSDIEYRFSGITNYIREGEADNCAVGTELRFCPGIYFSNLLNDTASYNDSLMIKGGRSSKVVTSSVQRTDGFCTRRLIFYSDGEIKIQYPSSHIIHLRMVWNGEDIELHCINREKDY
jgi:hypothetical protein